MSRRRPRALAAAPAALCLLVAGCSGIANLNIPTPPSTPAPPQGATTTVSLDLSAVSLAPVAAGPPPTVSLTPGQASLSGIVTGPAGVVGGATVLVERLVGDAVGNKTVVTMPDGTWKLPGIVGGRYRLRAWHVPDLTMTTPQIMLLGAKDNPNVVLILMAFNGQGVTGAISPNPPQVGVPAILAVQATQQTVGGDGVVRGAPLPGANILLTAAGNVVLVGTNPGTTDAAGRMIINLGCAAIGPIGLTATVNSVTSFPVTVPDCSPYVPPVTTIPTTTIKPPTSSVP